MGGMLIAQRVREVRWKYNVIDKDKERKFTETK